MVVLSIFGAGMLLLALVIVYVRGGFSRPPPRPKQPVLGRLRFVEIRCPRCGGEFEDGQEAIQWPDGAMTHPACTPELQVEGARVVDGFGGRR